MKQDLLFIESQLDVMAEFVGVEPQIFHNLYNTVQADA